MVYDFSETAGLVHERERPYFLMLLYKLSAVVDSAILFFNLNRRLRGRIVDGQSTN